VADKNCYHLDFTQKEMFLLTGGTFQPSFGTRDFKSNFRAVPGNSGLVVTIPASQESRLKSSRLEHTKDQTAGKIVQVMNPSGSKKPVTNYA